MEGRSCHERPTKYSHYEHQQSPVAEAGYPHYISCGGGEGWRALHNAETYSYRAEIPNANDQEPELLTVMSCRVDNAVQILVEAFHQRKRKRFRPNSDKKILYL